MNNEVVRINQIKLGYSEATKSVIAKVVTVFDNGMKQERLVKKLSLISDMLNSFAKQEKLSISELIDKGLIIVDVAKLKDKEVIIKDDEKGYRKVFFDKNTGVFVDRRLNRSERKELGLISYDDSDETIVSEDEEVTVKDTSEETEMDEKNLVSIVDVVNELRILNPDADIKLGDATADSKYLNTFLSSVPADKLVLPKGFYYNEKNGITNKNHTTSGSYITLDVELLEKEEEKEEDTTVSDEEEKEDIIVSDDETKNLIGSDGARDVSDSVSETASVVHETKEGKKKKAIKLLKVAARAAAIIGAGYIIVKSGIFNFNNTKNEDSRSEDNNNTRYEDNVESMENVTNYSNEEPNIIYVDNNVPDIVDENVTDNVEFMIQRVNDLCFSFEPCALNDLVGESDKMTITAINDARNSALSGGYDVVDLLDNYVKYVFEGSTMFNGTVVKAYDYLTPFAQYAVLVSNQSMLQLCRDYNYSTAYNVYDFENVCDSLDNLIDQTYRELNVNNKTL